MKRVACGSCNVMSGLSTRNPCASLVWLISWRHCKSCRCFSSFTLPDFMAGLLLASVPYFQQMFCVLTLLLTLFLPLYHFLNKCIYLFIFGCVGSSLLHAGFLQLQRAGATLRCGAPASHCGGFSCCGARALGVWASVVVVRGLSSCGARALECRLSSCGTWAQLFCHMWDLPGPGLEPVSPALVGDS